MGANEDVVTKVVRAADEANEPQDNLIRLSTGVVLRGKQAPPLILMSVMSAFPRPKPPVYRNEKMGRDMENSDDPEYVSRVKTWQTEQGDATLNALILCGTELVSKPESMSGPDDKAWLDEYEMFNLPMRPDSKAWRYLRWVQHKCAITADDIGLIMKVVGRLSGIPESAVQTAEQFPGSDKDSRR